MNAHAMHNAVARQQRVGETGCAAIATACARILALQPGSAAPATGYAHIVEACSFIEQAVMSPQVVLTSAAGKAHQAVALAAALSVIDAADMLRNLSTLVTTVAGVGLAHHLATGQPGAEDAVAHALRLLDAAQHQFSRAGEQAAAVLRQFPSG